MDILEKSHEIFYFTLHSVNLSNVFHEFTSKPDANSHFQTLNEILIQTYTYSNLWRVTNVVFGGVSFHLWIKKGLG